MQVPKLGWVGSRRSRHGFKMGGTIDATLCGCDFCGKGFERENIVELDSYVGIGDVLRASIERIISNSSNSVKRGVTRVEKDSEGRMSSRSISVCVSGWRCLG